jgi:hypothetical protein
MRASRVVYIESGEERGRLSAVRCGRTNGPSVGVSFAAADAGSPAWQRFGVAALEGDATPVGGGMPRDAAEQVEQSWPAR